MHDINDSKQTISHLYNKQITLTKHLLTLSFGNFFNYFEQSNVFRNVFYQNLVRKMKLRINFE